MCNGEMRKTVNATLVSAPQRPPATGLRASGWAKTPSKTLTAAACRCSPARTPSSRRFWSPSRLPSLTTPLHDANSTSMTVLRVYQSRVYLYLWQCAMTTTLNLNLIFFRHLQSTRILVWQEGHSWIYFASEDGDCQKNESEYRFRS